jgi:CheY-like chemotaxis protein
MEKAHATRSQILIVDDDEDVRDVLEMLLDDNGFDVVTAANGRRALELLESGETPSLILLDLMMPVMSGWDLWDSLQQSPAYRDIPVIVLTASGLTQGCIGRALVLSKPVGPTDLLAAIHTAAAPPG